MKLSSRPSLMRPVELPARVVIQMQVPHDGYMKEDYLVVAAPLFDEHGKVISGLMLNGSMPGGSVVYDFDELKKAFVASGNFPPVIIATVNIPNAWITWNVNDMIDYALRFL
jgi:hypothetical protein